MRFLVSVFAFFLIFSAAAAEKFISVNTDSGFVTIVNPYYQVTMFPGHLFPVFWKNKHGVFFPKTEFRDRLIDKETKKVYSLSLDRMGIHKIIRENADRCTIETAGTFCLDHETAVPGKVKARYQWSFSRKSPDIQVSVFLERESSEPDYIPRILEISWKDEDYTFDPESKADSVWIRATGTIPFSFSLRGTGSGIIVSKVNTGTSSMRISGEPVWKNSRYECSAVITLCGK